MPGLHQKQQNKNESTHSCVPGVQWDAAEWN